MLDKKPTYDELLSLLETKERAHKIIVKSLKSEILKLQEENERLKVTRSVQRKRLYESSNLISSLLEDEIDLERTSNQIRKLTGK